jgi:Flp pilus assembly protein TadD
MVALEIQSLQAGKSKIPRDAAVRLLEGNEHFAAGALDSAIREYESALELHPRFKEALNNLGAALGQAGRPEDALACFMRSLEIEPNDAVTLGNVALVYVLLDEVEKALDYFGQSLALERNYRTLNNRATLLARVGRLDEALNDLSTALELVPEDDVALFNRSGILLAMGRTHDAFRDVEALKQRLPDSIDVAQRRREIIDASLHQLVESGLASWSGKRVQGSKNPIPITAGPPVSDYVVEDRR